MGSSGYPPNSLSLGRLGLGTTEGRSFLERFLGYLKMGYLPPPDP